ncbi:MAG: hypothetical protein FWG36_02140 [Oscillospiraceae bacterium]|nr:hypothetical protein [Oscillospiraceae bacterium]
MNEYTIRFINWIYLHFGTAGQICAIFLTLAVPFGILWLLQLLPVPKNQVLCNYCVYENPNKNSSVYCCQHYSKCRAFQIRAAVCPHIENKGGLI